VFTGATGLPNRQKGVAVKPSAHRAEREFPHPIPAFFP
jgi:hypothetical protein